MSELIEEGREMERKQNEFELRKIEGLPQHIEINERTLIEYRKGYSDKGLIITKEEEYPREDFHVVAKQKLFDSQLDIKQGIRKVIENMIRQPITIFDKKGKPTVKDCCYYRGYWYGFDSRGAEIGAPFSEGFFKKPRMQFVVTDFRNPFDSRTGERKGSYRAVGNTIEHYIFLSEDKKERRKQLEDIVSKATGTYTSNLSKGHLHYRNPSANNDHSGTHGGSFNWDQFCDLSIEELGEAQNKNYYKEKSTGLLKDRDGVRVNYNQSTEKMEAIK